MVKIGKITRIHLRKYELQQAEKTIPASLSDEEKKMLEQLTHPEQREDVND